MIIWIGGVRRPRANSNRDQYVLSQQVRNSSLWEKTDVENAIHQLSVFITGPEGAAAMRLLEITHKRVFICVKRGELGRKASYFLTGGGFCCYDESVSAMLGLSERDVVEAAIALNGGQMSPKDITPFLIHELDKVADSVE